MGMKARVKRTLWLVLIATIPFSLQAKGNAVDGKEKAIACEACHGISGESTDPTFPNLAGQHASDLAQALSDYRSGARKNPIMSGMVSSLSNQDILDLAAWYASQDGLQDISIK